MTQDNPADDSATSQPDEILVLAVTDEDLSDDEDVSEDGYLSDLETADTGDVSGVQAEMTATLTQLQAELAGTARTGIPAVDAALERLADLDPGDLAGSTEILQDVLKRLEGTIQDS